jgi:sugar-specific transcriptional regulator TrmB
VDEEMKQSYPVTTDILESLDQIFESGLRGTHLLFSNSMIREAFRRKTSKDLLADESLTEQVQLALADLLDVESLDERQEYIESLDPETRDILVHLYFGFLDKYMNYDDEQPSEVLH